MRKHISRVLVLVLGIFLFVSCTTSTKLLAPVISYNESDTLITWNKVTNAQSYIVKIDGSEKSPQSALEYSLKDFESGTHLVVVYALDSNNNRSNASNTLACEVSVKKVVLDTPVLTINENKISWEKISNAIGYIVIVNNVELEIQTSLEYILENPGSFLVKVVAVPEDGSLYLRSNESVSANIVVPEKYQVAFKDYDGTILKEMTVTKLASAIAPSNPSRDDYKFVGWDKDFTNITSDLVVNALYEKEVFSVAEALKLAVDITAKVRGQVIALSSEGILLYDTEYIYVQLEDTSGVKVNDLVVVSGKLVLVNNQIQISNVTNLTVEGTKEVLSLEPNLIEDLDSYIQDFKTGDYFTATGLFFLYDSKYLFWIWGDECGFIADKPFNNGAIESYNSMYLTFTGYMVSYQNSNVYIILESFTLPKFTVTFLDSDGSVIHTDTVDYLGTAYCEAPTKEGYTFIGWDKSITNITSDLVVTALYEEVEVYTHISDVLTSPLGIYKVKGQVIAVSDAGFLLYDNSSIFVYTGSKPTVNKNDYVTVDGTTSMYGGKIQFTVGAIITKIEVKNEISFTPIIINSLDLFISSFETGTYFEIEGTLFKDGTYYNVLVNNSSKYLSINYPTNLDEIDYYLSQEVIIRGFALYTVSNGNILSFIIDSIDFNTPTDTFEVIFYDLFGNILSIQNVKSGQSAYYVEPPVMEGFLFTGWNKNFNNVTSNLEIKPIYAVIPYSSIKEVLDSPVGEYYYTKGIVVATNEIGALIYDGDFIFVPIPYLSMSEIINVLGVTTENMGVTTFSNQISYISKGYDYTVYLPNIEIEDFDDYVNDYNIGDYIVITGILEINNNNYSLKLANSTNKIDFYYPNTNGLTPLNNSEIKIWGYVLGYDANLMIILDSFIEIEVEKDIVDISILTVNDLHGYIEMDEYGQNGIANTAYLINQIRTEKGEENVFLVGNGDMFQGTGLSNMSKGLTVLDSMNAMNFDFMGIGNHEFDWELQTILDYFDGDDTNGEADFPLLNANVYYVSSNKLVTMTGGNVLQSTIIDRGGVSVGFISYIGDVYSSISKAQSAPYYFDLDISSSVSEIATILKSSGADMIVVNIHGGYSSSITNYNYNVQLAQLKDSSGNYLVDAVINGHTHTRQTGYITRPNGVNMPVVQAGSYNNAFGNIILSYDLVNNKVVGSEVYLVDVSSASTNYDPAVQAVVDHYNEVIGNQVLVTSGETIFYTSQLRNWVGNVTLAATGADVFVSNTGGIRATGGITFGKGVSVRDLYEVSPFDNDIYLMEISGYNLRNFLNNSSLFSTLAPGITIADEQTYTMAIISFVYFFDQLTGIRNEEVDFNTGLYVRDLLIEDLLLYNEGEIFYPISNPTSKLQLQVEYPPINLRFHITNYTYALI